MNQLQQNELSEVEDIQSFTSEDSSFKITDLDSLNWAFRKLSVLKAKEEEFKQFADKEINRIMSWLESELSTIESSKKYFEVKIQEYHMNMLENDPKAKTISTPYGKTKARKSAATVEAKDKEALLQYAIENNMDDYLKTELKWGEMKKSLQIAEIAGEKVVISEDGEIVPGVSVKPESITYSVDVDV